MTEPTINFSRFYERACKRKGGEKAMLARMPRIASLSELKQLDDRDVLSTITRCIFRAGFVWRIIEAKWPGFEEAFKNFVPLYWQQVPPEVLEELSKDQRIVRNPQKINTVPANARMIVEVSEQYSSFGQFLGQWPSAQQAELLHYIKKNGSRLGGITPQYVLRELGWDGFILSSDVVTALTNHNLMDASPTSQKGLKQAQAAFNHWHQKTRLPYSHLSRILSYSVGD
ncbi:DNA-3-methyladenine glycosylase I [Idiomarina aminovorans]|uniref:DNA-3-methyladenine glycosylase I n=1 Tax=Idiomarina aminovorans TaxID=2914829 RepID=UPI002003C348|nr:DNA-3-methyladenine glycosylase I [Idiomarina sp. ATCH4]MCK7460519.1 DNA-3-methyladenine glycosylase I [Idiomarina sp. ATCH4]